MTETLTAKRPWSRFEPEVRLPHKKAAIPNGYVSQSDLDRRIDEGYRRNEAERHRSYLAAFESSRIRELLRQVDPEGKAPYGTRFVERMLATEHGKRGLERFINRALAIMDVENGLDIVQDFTDVQRDMLLNDDEDWKPFEQRIKENKATLAKGPGQVHAGLSRRAMMGLGVVGAAGLTAEGLVGGAAHLAELSHPHRNQEPEGWRRELQKTQERVEAMESLVLAAIGVHYAHDVHVEHGRVKDEEVARRVKQVEDVVYDLAQLCRAERPRRAAERYRGIVR
ncbi:MAG: hypothetical protein K2X09_05970 [Rickettsiales bacterium]|nr:hypothetical protein [Rickettsiales bacterium]